MKKIALFIAIVVLTAGVVAQDLVAPTQPLGSEPESAAPVSVAPAELVQVRGERYVVYSELGVDSATALKDALESLFGLYNEYLRFDPATLTAPLQVRAFASKAAFDAYLEQVAGQTKDDFVYLHYSSLERSELVVFEKEAADFEASLAHQAFVQFIKAFVPNPPLWIQEGFAVYFETARWDAERTAVSFVENTAWLETVKALKARGALLKPEQLLAVGFDESREKRDVFYPQSWAFVSFLANSPDRRYNRFLWDAISSLDAKASFEENLTVTGKLFSIWYPAETAEKDFLSWIDGQKTFADLVTEGVAAYGAGQIDAAGEVFSLALEKNDENYIPYYYLGLVAYAKNDFALADFYYKTALELGCDPAVTNYALGINAFASNRFADAKTYLAKAKTSAPDRYTAKVDELVARIDKKK